MHFSFKLDGIGGRGVHLPKRDGVDGCWWHSGALKVYGEDDFHEEQAEGRDFWSNPITELGLLRKRGAHASRWVLADRQLAFAAAMEHSQPRAEPRV